MRQRHPNLVYILADDMGYGDLSCLNSESKVHTAHLDRMAERGMAFGDAHSSSAVCTPSRYSILTGRYSWRSALKAGVLDGYDGPLLERERTTVASYLRRHEYATCCVGKWHLGWEWGRSEGALDFSKPVKGGPVDRGFDKFFGIAASLDFPPYVYVDGAQPTTREFRRFDADAEGYVEKRFMRSGLFRNMSCRIAHSAPVNSFMNSPGKTRPFFSTFP
ncbi:MAG: sulfatase-like hydrolase/transferase [Verrucomicrobia bacterium]|nr:sulfatase-like hydrolase/transferase [Verrucomicrobiota bacterium]